MSRPRVLLIEDEPWFPYSSSEKNWYVIAPDRPPEISQRKTCPAELRAPKICAGPPFT